MSLPPPYDRLGLSELEGESGLFRVESVSRLEVSLGGRPMPAGNCISYALTRSHPQNHLHWLAGDDSHVLIDGGPADYYQFFPNGRVERQRMGRALDRGECLIVTTPGDCWKAVRLDPEADFLLVGSVVTPAWAPDRVRVGAGQAFVDRYAGAADWARPEFLKELIGPNFG